MIRHHAEAEHHGKVPRSDGRHHAHGLVHRDIEPAGQVGAPGSVTPVNHPFTAPHEADVHLLDSAPGEVRFLLQPNGVELPITEIDNAPSAEALS